MRIPTNPLLTPYPLVLKRLLHLKVTLTPAFNSPPLLSLRLSHQEFTAGSQLEVKLRHTMFKLKLVFANTLPSLLKQAAARLPLVVKAALRSQARNRQVVKLELEELRFVCPKLNRQVLRPPVDLG